MGALILSYGIAMDAFKKAFKDPWVAIGAGIALMALGGAVSHLASKGVGVRVLASLAGHKSIAVTQKYIDTNDDMKRNAVELI